MSRVFIDVGGYHGESSRAALDPLFEFDRIFCFEPVGSCAAKIRTINNRRLVVIEACLLDRNGQLPIHNPGTLAASIYGDAPVYGGEFTAQTVNAIDVVDFFASFLGPDDEVWMKLNCEGAECDILDRLLGSRHLEILKNVLVDFDAGKIPSQHHRVPATMAKLGEKGVNYCVPEDVQFGMVNNFGGIRNWLVVSGAANRGIKARLGSLVYNLSIVVRHPECSGYHKMKLLETFPFLSIFARSRRRTA